MSRSATRLFVLGLVAMGINASVHAQIIEPNIGFCAPPASASKCSTSWSFFAAGSSAPENFTFSSGPNDIYSNLGSPVGKLSYPPSHHRGSPNNSMNATNTFSPLEQAAFGGIPSDLQLQVDTSTTGHKNGDTADSFTRSTLSAAETFIADLAAECDRYKHRHKRRHEPDSGPVPEPASLVMLSSGLVLLAGVLRRRFTG